MFFFTSGLVRLSSILETARGDGYHIAVRQLETYQGKYTSMLKEIKDQHQYRLIIDCDVDKVETILDQVSPENVNNIYSFFGLRNEKQMCG